MNFGKRSFNYIKKHKNHYKGYLIFGSLFFLLSHQNKSHKNEVIRIGFAGAIAQFTTEILFHPIDVINTRTKAEIAKKGINSMTTIKTIMASEGLYGFWRGASSTYYGALVGGFIYFSAYKYLKNKLKVYEQSEKLNSFAYLVSSLLGETLFLVIYYPYDLIRTRMQTRMPEFNYKGPFDGLKRIMGGSMKNVKNIYTGAAPSFVLNLANQSIMFTVLESLREYFLKKQQLHSISQLSMPYYLFCSIIAGAISGAATNTLEVITIHKQVDPKFKFTCFIKEQGIKSLTQGLIARMTLNTLQCTTLFFVVDYVSKMFDVEL